MKKTFVVLFVLALIIAGAFFYIRNYRNKKIDSWLLVPSSAILAYENDQLIENWNSIVATPIWKSIKNIPYFQHWEEGLIKADSLSGKNGSLDKLFRNKSLIVSLHITSSNEFDFLFNLDLGDLEGKSVFDHVIRSIQKENALISKSRNYQGYELNELVNKTTKSTFTYLIYQDVVVGSFTPFLVEDVVRTISDGFKDTFRSQVQALMGTSRLENDDGDIYVDFGKIPDFFTLFLNEDKAPEMKKLLRFSGDTYLDLKVTDNELLLNGISMVDRGSNSYIGTFINQNPGKISITDLVPNSTALLYHLAFSDFKTWQSQQSKYWSSVDPDQFQRAMDFEQRYSMSLDWIVREAAIAILETPNKEQPEQLIFIGIQDRDVVFNELKDLAEQISQEQSDSVYIEMYNDEPILQLPYSEFPSAILGQYFSGFENSFFTIYDNYLVVGNSMKVVKDFINSMENETNWGKSVRQSVFLENTLSESNFSLMINMSMCWQMLMNNLNEKWSKLARTYENEIKSFDLMAFQISNLDERFYTSLAIGHRQKIVSSPKVGRLKKIQSVYTISPIVTKPYIVKNHNNNKLEVLVQDSLNILYQISNEGDILWGDSIQDKIVSDIYQIDYYKNSKLQYLFATSNKLHLLDRNGDYVENYPVKLKDGIQIEHLSVVDYDNSKKYRFMVVDRKGNIYLYSKEGKNLEGWTPRPLESRLAIPGFHIRVRGGDCMVALQENGVLNVLNRRGNMYPGFPIDLKVRKTSDLFVDIGNDFESTKLITVSDEGEVIEVNLRGKILKREQLYKPTRESKFWLVNDALQKTFVIARQEYNKISILSRDGELMLEKNIISSGDLFTQYYNFSSDNQVFAFIDQVQEFAYLFDNDGQAISFEPLECSKPISLMYLSRTNEFLLYTCYLNNFTVQSFR